VVADEIGKLAEQSGENTKAVSTIVRKTNSSMANSYESLNTGIVSIEEIFRGLADFNSRVNKVSEMTLNSLTINDKLQKDTFHFQKRSEELLSSLDEQKITIGEVSSSVESINDSAQSFSASSEELSSISQSIASSASDLKKSIEFFHLNLAQEKNN
jgi:methyl-accepting chemotaxis protein